MDVELQNVIARFPQVKGIREIQPVQAGLINRTYRIVTDEADDYILQLRTWNCFSTISNA